MKLLITSQRITSQTTADQLQQFLESPHRRPGPGVKFLARWFSLTFDLTYVVVETEDVRLVSDWLMNWRAFATYTIAPVMDDADVVQLLNTATKPN